MNTSFFWGVLLKNVRNALKGDLQNVVKNTMQRHKTVSIHDVGYQPLEY